MALVLAPLLLDDEGAPRTELSPRLAQALAAGRDSGSDNLLQEEEVEFDAAMTWSGQEALHQRDFEKMTVEEIEAARRAIGRVRLPIMEVPTRRFRTDRAGPRADMRATIRAALRTGGAILPLKRRPTRTRPPPPDVRYDLPGTQEPYAA